MRINQNIAALNSYRHLSITDTRLNRSLERLSSGLRINRAADDAAGLAISEKMRAQVSGLRMALRNCQDGISLMQTAEGAINEIHSMLQRMRELAVQAANETYTSADRMEIQKEIEQLKLEINRVSSATEFNTKKLLDGSSAAIVSTDSPTTHVYMRDGLRRTDEFGQKLEGGGNFKIDVQAQEIGSSQVQKSNIFMVKHESDTLTWENVAGTDDLEGNFQLQAAKYDLDALGQFDLVLRDNAATAGTISAVNTLTATQAQLSGGEDIAADGDFTTAAATFYVVVDGGAAQEIVLDQDYSDRAGVVAAINEQLSDATVELDGDELRITSHSWGEDSSLHLYGDNISGAADIFNADSYLAKGRDAHVTVTVDVEDGVTTVQDVVSWLRADTTDINYYEGTPPSAPSYQISDMVKLEVNNHGQVINAGGASVTTELTEGGSHLAVGDLATEDTRLYDIREFWDANGRFLLENPRTITIVQGDGKQTLFTIDRNDTLGTLREKINKAISDQKPQFLGQSRYTEGDVENKFAEYITEPGEGHRSVKGTIVVRSVIPGRQGDLELFGNSEIINALGFQSVQNSTETVFDITVTDAHSGEIVDENVRISSNLMVGVVHPNVDVEFDPLAGMTKVTALDDRGGFDIKRDTEPLTSFIHLKDNTLIFQIGPNPGQDVGAAVGRMDARALGVNGILVTDRIKANEAIDFIDRAMDLVSGERSKLGAVQNRLEHTVNSLSVAIENLTASESRIRDLDIAEEMVNFTKDQILMQAGSAMLAQANMKPQSIMQLLG